MRNLVSVSRCSLLVLLVTGTLLMPIAFLHAQETEPSVSAPAYGLPWWTVDGGGSTEPATSRSYTLVGTIGQPDAGEMGGPRYGLEGGFWASVPVAAGYDYQVYLPLVVRNTP
jgi:hypothetical protein